ncbi:RHS repeat-associated core domain-containing protein [Tahibacter soli]|uniref:RHS repeat-associated protein n=1 Tax=Tahibacter soli TaxID=2983605 RepID=A0A9X4BHL5_9GAMM|nr:RHS repeat-associated core domain-containing protein [Tahibacter soli]MDC8013016.1 hypothetical protein [Tahibacter soli]
MSFGVVGARGGPADDPIFADGFEPRPPCLPGVPDADGDNLIDLACATPFVPPDPAAVATPIDPTVATDFHEATRFLYAGPEPVQRGVAPDAIRSWRAAVLRGRVLDGDGAPLPGVLVRVLDRPELGYTYTRADGMYDLAVNGGGELTVDLRKQGYLRAQRAERAPWKDWRVMPDTRMVALDDAVTTIGLTPTSDVQVHRANLVADADGARRATVIFPAGVTGELVAADGTRRPLSTIRFRATEYTVGPEGPQRMPASLPASAGYTYAVELGADEAVAQDARSVEFDRPIVLYFENYLNFSTGSRIPLGYYDFRRGSWLPAPNGRVVRIVGNVGALALLDIDGSGTPADDAALTALGVTAGERAKLAQIYPVGQVLWRSAMTHLTPWDCNYPYGPDPNPDPPQPPEPPDDPPYPDDPPTDPTDPGPPTDPDGDDDPAETDEAEDTDESDCETGSVIDCTNARLGESVPIPGTPVLLTYRSDRVPGGTPESFSVRMRLSGAAVPRQVRSIESEICVGGQCFRESEAPAPNRFRNFAWNGLDAYGRQWQGSAAMTARIGYAYGLVYQATSDAFEASWAGLSGVAAIERGTGTATLWSRYAGQTTITQPGRSVGAWSAAGLGLGGWSISLHHVFDPQTRTLYYGDGTRRRIGMVGDGGATIVEPFSSRVSANHDPFALDADGTAFQLETFPRRDAPNGSIGRQLVYAHPPGSDTSIELAQSCPPDDDNHMRCAPGSTPVWRTVHRLVADDRSRVILIADTGVFRVNGGGAIEALLPAELAGRDCTIDRLAAWFERRLYFACVDSAEKTRLFTLWPDGQVTLLAGGGSDAGADVAASAAQFERFGALAIGPDGTLFATEPGANRIRRIGTDGRVTIAAGNGTAGFTPDGATAAGAAIGDVMAIAVSHEGTLLFAESPRIREIAKNGQLRTVVGGGDGYPSRETQSLGRALSVQARSIESLPDGSIVFDDWAGGVLRSSHSSFRLDGPEAAITIASQDARELYVFDRNGRHLQTRDAITGAVRYAFRYDPAGRLVEIEDGDGNVTRIVRNAAGVATAIVGPYGTATTLTINAAGYLEAIDPPLVDPWRMTYKPGYAGLLQTFTDPRGYASAFEWTLLGRLSKDTDAEGGYQELVSYAWDSQRARESSYESALGRKGVSYRRRAPGGDAYRTSARSDGLERHLLSARNASQAVYDLRTGMFANTRFNADPRYGFQAPVAGETGVAWGTSVGVERRSRYVQTGGDGTYDVTETREIDTRVFARAYTAADRTWTFTTPMGREMRIVVDAQSRPLRREIAGVAPVEYAYDGRGRLTGVAQGQGALRRKWSYTYDANGYLASVEDPLERVVEFESDAIGRRRVQRLPGARAIALDYDANGNLTGVQPPGRPVHGFTYNKVNTMTAYRPPAIAGGAVDRTYTPNLDRQLAGIADPDGRTIGVGYIASRTQPQTLTLPGAARTFGYTFNGLAATIDSTSEPSLAFEWDGPFYAGYTTSGAIAGRVQLLRGAVASAPGQFWLNGIRTTAGGDVHDVSYDYDRDGLMLGATFDAGTPVALSLARDPANGLLRGTQIGLVADTRGYDTFGELDDYAATFDGDPLLHAAYTFDKLGRVVARTETIAGATHVTAYTYDVASRLDTVTVDGVLQADYDYDANSNRRTATTPAGATNATFDDQDRLATWGAQTFEYNRSGQLAARRDGDDVTRYDYDALGNLRHVDLPDGTDVDYVIDGLNRRVGRKVDGALVQGFLYVNQLKPAAELDGAGNIVASFVYADRQYAPSFMVKAGRAYRIVADRLGSPRLVVDVETGAIAQRMDYDAWGNVTLDTNPGFQPFGFAGGLYDRATKLTRFGARDYDATTGRWTAKDPVGFGGGQVNLYAYAGNDPVNLFDPGGYRLSWNQVANIVFNETRSLDGPGIDQARKDVAHAVINGDEQFGNARPQTSTTRARVPREERDVYEQCKSATIDAFIDEYMGIDPTNDATHFNMRRNDSRKPFQGHEIETQNGPFENSYPTPDLPGTGIYLNTYR